MAGSTKSVGRLDFILRILVATALAVEWNRVLPLKELVNPYLFSSRWDVFIHIAGYPFVAILVLSAISGRLLDAKLPILYIFPITFIWIFSTVTFMFGLHYWPFGLALFVFLLIMGGILPIKPAPVRTIARKGSEIRRCLRSPARNCRWTRKHQTIDRKKQ